MRNWLLVGVLVVALGTFVCAENRWVVGAKSGAGAGLIGVEGEKEWNGFSLWLASGISEGAIGYGLGLRWYFSPAPVNRGFAEIIVGGVASTSGIYDIALPYVGLGMYCFTNVLTGGRGQAG